MSKTIQDLELAVGEFADARDWAQFHDPKNLSMAIASEAGELCSVLRWVSTSDSDNVALDPNTLPKLKDEIADVAILLLLLCRRLKLDLGTIVLDKLEKNEGRYPIVLSHGRAGRPESSGSR